jgi:hypothetical protein
MGLQHRRAVVLAAAAAVALAVTVAPAGASTGDGGSPTNTGNTEVTVDQPYVKANGRTPSAGDAIKLCGANRRAQNEPSAAMDPRAASIVVAGSNDYCTVEGAGGTWTGFYRSTDSGGTWTDSLLPGYPTDDSPEGLASPLQQRGITNAGDPVQAWDNDGRLFYMGNAFNRTQPQNGSVWVATYDNDATRYLRTVVVGKGGPAFASRFNDKTAIEVDRSDTATEGNVYAAWSLFQGAGANSIYFVRSTNHGQSFSKPVKLSEGSQSNQFADITVDSAGTVYVAWRRFPINPTQGEDAMMVVRSTDGGRTFTRPHVATQFMSFDAADTAGDPAAAAQAHEQAYENADGPAAEAGAEEESVGNSRDCGSGPFACQSGFVFFRHDSQVRITADPTGAGTAGTLWAVFDATDEGTVVPSETTYNTAEPAADGSLQVGQGRIYLTRSTDLGRTWSEPVPLSEQETGHQFFPDINADAGYLHAVWHDSRLDPAYSVQFPPGNDGDVRDAAGFAAATHGLDTYAVSWSTAETGPATGSDVRLTTASQMPNYEMFGDRRVPFHGDYNYVTSVGVAAYNVWTDTRDSEPPNPGDDPRYAGGEGFDAYQCRALTDGIWGADTCPNVGGLDQDIFGSATTG